MQRSVTHRTQARHQVTLPTHADKPLTARIGIANEIGHIIRCASTGSRRHQVQRLGCDRIILLPFTQVIDAIHRLQIGIHSIRISRIPLVVILTDRTEDGYLVPTALTEIEMNRQVEDCIGRLMHPKGLIRCMVCATGCSQQRVIGIAHRAVHVVRAQITHFVPGITHPMMTERQTELKPPNRLIIEGRFGKPVGCNDRTTVP